jgi:DNA-binding transcriptional LysR family regulator
MARAKLPASAAAVHAAPDGPLRDWEDVRYFLSAARTRSFSGAARALGSDQSTVSRRIAALEAALGQRLFERGPRALAPTALGVALIEPAEQVERAMLSVADAARATERRVEGRVRIALTEGLAQHVVVPVVLPALLARHPGLSIELLTSDVAVDLARHEADVAIRFFRTPKGPLVGRRIARLPLAVLVARSKVRALRGRAPTELPWIRYVHPSFVPLETSWLEALGVTRAHLSCTSVETQLAAVRAGLGVAVATRAFLRAMPDLCELPGLALPDAPALELFVATRAAIRKVPRVAAVYDALVEELAALERA